MRCTRVLAFAVIMALGHSAAQAEPLIQTLPEEGEWVRFHVNMNVGDLATTPEWSVKSVGRKEISGTAYRWIELQSQEDHRNVVLFKCLVAEAEFGKGKDPLAHAHQVFVKHADHEPREVESLAAADAPLALILSGPTDAKKLDEKEPIELQDGRIECDVYTGKSKSEFGGNKIELSHRLLMSDKVPYRLAALKLKIDAEFAGKPIAASIEVTFKETGKDARSELPMIQ